MTHSYNFWNQNKKNQSIFAMYVYVTKNAVYMSYNQRVLVFQHIIQFLQWSFQYKYSPILTFWVLIICLD